MTTTKKSTRIISILLVFIFSLSLAMSASAKVINTSRSTSKIAIVTCGDKLFKKTSKITIKNNSSDPLTVTFTKISGCKVFRATGAGFSAWSSMTILAGNSATFTIKTSRGNCGQVQFKAVNSCDGCTNYNVTGTNYQSISWIG